MNDEGLKEYSILFQLISARHSLKLFKSHDWHLILLTIRLKFNTPLIQTKFRINFTTLSDYLPPVEVSEPFIQYSEVLSKIKYQIHIGSYIALLKLSFFRHHQITYSVKTRELRCVYLSAQLGTSLIGIRDHNHRIYQ